MKIIFMIRACDINRESMQEIYLNEHWKIEAFEKYCDEYWVDYDKPELVFCGFYYSCWGYEPEYYPEGYCCPDPRKRLYNKIGWKELFS